MQKINCPFRDCFTISSARNLVQSTRIDQIYKNNPLPGPTYEEKRLKTAKTKPQFDLVLTKINVMTIESVLIVLQSAHF